MPSGRESKKITTIVWLGDMDIVSSATLLGTIILGSLRQSGKDDSSSAKYKTV